MQQRLEGDRVTVLPQRLRTEVGFLDHLVTKGALDGDSLAQVLEACRRSGQKLTVVVTELGLVNEARLLQEMAGYFDLPLVQATELPVEPAPVDLDRDFLLRNRLLPLGSTDTDLICAISDPFDGNLLPAVAYFLDRRVTARLAAPRDLDAALRRLYAVEAVSGTNSATLRDDDIERLKEAASEAPVVRVVARILANAVLQRASDIHIEPLPNVLMVRYRIDGVLADVEQLSADQTTAIATRVKILANLNIAERRLPQDGRTKAMVAGRQIDVRVSCVPTQHGESIVLRLLDQEKVDLTFDSLGLDGFARSAFERMLHQPNGIVLVTGPTGSGKTTTLYAALKLLNSRERKVFSVEDPIEYQLAGVNQLQVKHEIGLDFVQALRSILRQDPDVIMVGEIRDVETARTAIQASLTGHLVLSTLHTNSAASSLTRLIDMGVEPYLLASSLSGVLAQRLVRRLCANCARETSGDRAMIEGLLTAAPELANRPRVLLAPAGCPQCRGTGFAGRTAITEALVVDGGVRSALVQQSGELAIEREARTAGMEPLLSAGLRKAFAGETTIEEVLRVARL